MLSRDAVSSPPSWVGRVRYAVIQWCVDRARVALLAHEARGVRSPTLAMSFCEAAGEGQYRAQTKKMAGRRFLAEQGGTTCQSGGVFSV